VGMRVDLWVEARILVHSTSSFTWSSERDAPIGLGGGRHPSCYSPVAYDFIDHRPARIFPRRGLSYLKTNRILGVTFCSITN